MTDAHHPAVQLERVTKLYLRGPREVAALRDVDLVVPRGEFCAVSGPSGSGKSTLLNLVAGMDTPTTGRVLVDGTSLGGLTEDRLTDMRRTRVGVIFQFFNLLKSISALENVALPLRATGMKHAAILAKASAALERVGLADRADHLPAELAGGEMQRVAIARALVIEPSIVLADEPTGNLDSATGGQILRLLRQGTQPGNLTIILVTHSAIAAAYADRVVALKDGAIANDVLNRPPKPAPHIRPVG